MAPPRQPLAAHRAELAARLPERALWQLLRMPRSRDSRIEVLAPARFRARSEALLRRVATAAHLPVADAVVAARDPLDEEATTLHWPSTGLTLAVRGLNAPMERLGQRVVDSNLILAAYRPHPHGSAPDLVGAGDSFRFTELLLPSSYAELLVQTEYLYHHPTARVAQVLPAARAFCADLAAARHARRAAAQVLARRPRTQGRT